MEPSDRQAGDSPTGNGSAGTNAALDKRRALIELRLRQRRAGLVGRDRVVPVARSGRLPLSGQQAGLWFLYQLDPGSPTYHLPVLLRLRGRLEITALTAAVRAVIARHEGLRTRFDSRDGEPFQIIDPVPEQPLSVAELPETGWQELVQAEVLRPFDLRGQGGFRCWLGRLGAEDHVLLLNCHHIITDGWSVGILLTDLAQAYQHARTQPGDDACGLDPLPVQPADYAAWERAQTHRWNTGLDYWRHQLTDLPTLAMPTDHPRPANPTGAGTSVEFNLPPELGEQAVRLAGELRVSLFSVLLAAFGVVVGRYCGQSDVALGSVFSGRTRSEVEPLVGFFANTVVLRLDLAGNPTVAELIARCQDTVLGALQHQDVPFTRVVDALQPPRQPGTNPLFQTSFSLLPAALGGDFQLGETQAESLPTPSVGARFDLSVQVAQAPDNSLSVNVEYASELCGVGRVGRLVEHFGVVLGLLVGRGGLARRVDGLEVVGAGERELLLGRFAAGAVPAGGLAWPGGLVPGLLAEAVAAHAGLCALDWDGGQLSYAEFGRAVSTLAGRLRGHGAGRGRVVALCARRSAQQVIGLHAILAAGAAFLPLDPDQPAARLGFQLADAEPVLLLAEPDLDLPVPAGLTRLPLHPPGHDPDGDEPPDEMAGDEDGFDNSAGDGVVGLAGLAAGVRGSDPAYLIYTSGSTGQPKAVINTHAGLANRLAWMHTSYPIGPADRVIQKTPATFDVSVWEFCWPLLTGARLALPSHTGHRDLPYLADFLHRHQISIAHFVPSVLRAFLTTTDTALPALRHLFCSGEALPADTRDSTLHRYPHTHLHNLYGPTEAAIDVTATTCTTSDGPTVSIGRPIANMRTYLLDPHTGQPSPIGIPGHLHLAGIGLASHYAHRPALTAEKFTPNPYGPPGDRLYATGDLAQWQPDGTLHYLGRTDHQIKLHGQRIEPGEIENTLTQHPAINHASVQLTTPPDQPPYLSAYLTTTPGHPTPTDTQIRTHLAHHLPLHMIPTTYHHLPQLPLTPNGKLDRTQLPQPSTPTTHQPPTTTTQHTLATIWADILNIPTTHITTHHNFFADGGSSLGLMRLIGDVRNRFGVELELRHLYLSPTLEAVAALVDERLGRAAEPVTGAAPDGPQLVPLRTGDGRPPLFLVHAIGGSAAPYLPLVQELDAEQPVYAFEAAGLSGSGRPAGSIEELAAEYLAMARTVQPAGPYRLAGWSVGGVIAQQVATLLRSAGEQVALLALFDSVPAEPDEPPELAELLDWFAHDLAGLRGSGPLPPADQPVASDTDPLAADADPAAPDADPVSLMLDRLERAGLTDAALRSQMRDRFEVFAALAGSFLRHRPQPVDVPIDLLVADDSPADPIAEWKPYGIAGLREHPVTGSHYTMLQPPHLSACAAVLNELLEQSGPIRNQ